MSFAHQIVAILAWLSAFSAAAHADIVFYRVPNTRITMMLQGRAISNPGGTVTFVHPKFDRVHLNVQDVRIHRVDSFAEIFAKKLARARRAGDVQELMDVAEWALRHGLLKETYEAVAEVLQLDPTHVAAIRIRELKQQMERSLPEDAEVESTLKQNVPVPGMRIERSRHFILLHDTPAEPAEGRELTRAQERLELLEQVYESFLLKFYSRGIELEIPQQRLMVALFHDKQTYDEYARGLSPELASATGFWSPATNVSVFFDHATAENHRALRELARRHERTAERARRRGVRNVGDVVRFARTLDLLVQVAQESADIEVVSHEATHQMAGNTGLFPRDVRIPAWAHEGLATYFESPNDAAWGGIGAVNEQRLKRYRALASDTEHSNIEFIVSDRIFDFAESREHLLHAYGQAWALTHFLLEKHPQEFIRYYRRLGEFPPDTPLSGEVLVKVFNEVFGEDHRALDREWRAYMNSLQTDLERILEREE